MFNSIRNWIKPPVYPGDEDKTRVAALLNSILWIFIAAASLYGILAPIEAEMTARRACFVEALLQFFERRAGDQTVAAKLRVFAIAQHVRIHQAIAFGAGQLTEAGAKAELK